MVFPGEELTVIHLLLSYMDLLGNLPFHGSLLLSGVDLASGRRLSPSPLAPMRLKRFKLLRCQKMFVPGFGEASPEAKGARHLHDFFTFVAVKIVLAQLESYNLAAYDDLMEFMNRNSLNDGDKFCARLMRESERHRILALRILEVRSAYCKSDFEWDNLKNLAFKLVDKSNTTIMREYVLETSQTEGGKMMTCSMLHTFCLCVGTAISYCRSHLNFGYISQFRNGSFSTVNFISIDLVGLGVTQFDLK